MIDKTQIIKPNTTPILFINWTDEDFTGMWDSVPTVIKAGEQLWLPLWLAQHFSKHLVDRELNKMALPTNHPTRESLVSKCIGNKGDAEDPTKANDDPLGIKAMNKNLESKPKSIVPSQVKNKGGRPKKIAVEEPSSEIAEEDSFEGK